MYQRIVVPVDSSDLSWTAIGPAKALAERWDADLEVISIVQFPWEVEHAQHEIENNLAAAGYLTGRAGATADPTVTVQVSRALRVAEELAIHVGAHPGSLVIMTSHGRGRSVALLGSVAEKLLQLVEGAPIMVLGPRVGARVDDSVGQSYFGGRMLICVDGSTESEAAVAEAARFAGSLEIEPWVISVADALSPASVGGESGRIGRSGLIGLSGETVVDTVYTHRVAEEMASELGRPVDFDTLHGSAPAEAIVDYARGYDTGLIVAATHGRTGLDRLTSGSVAMRIVHEAPCPVVLVRSDEGESS